MHDENGSIEVELAPLPPFATPRPTDQETALSELSVPMAEDTPRPTEQETALIDLSVPMAEDATENALFRVFEAWKARGKGSKESSEMIDLIELLVQFMDEIGYRFHPSVKSWFKYNRHTGLYEARIDLELKKRLHGVIRRLKVSPQLRHNTTLKATVEAMEVQLYLQLDELTTPPGLHFSNGWFCFEQQQLVPHSPTRFVSSSIACEYTIDTAPSHEVKSLLTILTCDNAVSLNHLRGFLSRGIVPRVACQTILLITGGPMTGKSMFVRWLKELFGPSMVSIDYRKKNHFDRAAWKNKRVLVVNDCYKIDVDFAEILRQLSGRDHIKYDQKYKQCEDDFIFDGIVVIVSNKRKESLIAHLMDDALSDRILEVPFEYRVKTPISDIGVLLTQSLPGLINWSLRCPPIIFNQQLRATHDGAERHTSVCEFLEERCQADPSKNGYAFYAALRESYQDFMASRGIVLTSSESSELCRIVEGLLLHTYSVPVRPDRVTQGMVLRGILMEPPKPHQRLRRKPTLPNPLQALNPWEMKVPTLEAMPTRSDDIKLKLDANLKDMRLWKEKGEHTFENASSDTTSRCRRTYPVIPLDIVA